MRQFTELLRVCHQSLSTEGFSLRDIALHCNVSKSTVSEVLHGKRKVPGSFLKSFHGMAVGTTNASKIPTLGELQDLHSIVTDEAERASEAERSSSCEACGRPLRATPRAVLDEPATPTEPPAARSADLPVPTSLGDRRNNWSAIDDLKGRLAAGQMADAAGIMRYAGQYEAPSETATAIAACLREGVPDAVSTISRYAAERPDEEILLITRSLLEAGVVDAAQNLVSLRLDQ
ncbi:hypothetical protein Aco04nite_31590 [Winogradskya consettensis]|uniref:Uncharacterized protein n=1 Tax=Winogradskya consettensis TaxID=113560 RepID=A0A919SJ68_9ACTN|nr:hypothetical protein Aco04nite_31590 [Actinoplanes consettensis]